jgi:sensor histidine kinase YesM
MSENSKFRPFHVPLWAILLMIVCGFSFMAIIDFSVFQGWRSAVNVGVMALVIGTIIFKGYEYIEFQIERCIPWLTAPVKRLSLTILLQSLYFSAVLSMVVVVLSLMQGVLELDALLAGFYNAAVPGLIFTVVATFLANFILFFRNWKQAVIREETLKRQQLALEYETLKNQVNPHFLFNSFTALSSLVYRDQDKAVDFIRQLSNVYRYVLEQTTNEVVPLSKEMEFVSAVAYLYGIRHENDLTVTISIEPQEGECVVPISLQMLIENAVKHNQISSQTPLLIKIYREDNYIVVSNNTHPRLSAAPSSGIGLANISSRYQYLAGRRVEVLKSKSEFTVKLPIIINLGIAIGMEIPFQKP